MGAVISGVGAALGGKRMSGAQLTAFYAIVGAYLLLVCGIGLYNYRRASTEEGFLAAGRSLGPILGGATLTWLAWLVSTISPASATRGPGR